MTNLVEKAIIFAKQAHTAVNHKRKYTDECYTTHPRAVADIIAEVNGTDRMMAVAWLHDTLEDTNTSYRQLETEFGREIAWDVQWLTDGPKVPGENRKVRKAKDRDRLAQAPSHVQTVKLADLIHNTESIVKHDPKFAVVYLEEKAALLKVLTGGDPALLKVAADQVAKGLECLNDTDATPTGWDEQTRGPRMSGNTGNRIWKYQMPASERFDMQLPAGAQIIRMAGENGMLWLWAVVDTQAKLETRRFESFKAGGTMPDDLSSHNYVGCAHIFIQAELMLYIFEVKNDT